MSEQFEDGRPTGPAGQSNEDQRSTESQVPPPPAGQPYPVQPYPVQPYPVQPYAGQPRVGQPFGPPPPPPTPGAAPALGVPTMPPAVAPTQRTERTERTRVPRSALVTTALVTALVTSAATGGVTWAIAGHDTRPAVTAASGSSSGSGTSTTRVREVSTNAPDWTAIADKVRESVVAIAVMSSGGSGEGSGVVLDTAGHVLTNNHVVSGAQQIKVTLADGRVYDATVVGTDPTTDLAVVAITDPPEDLTAATFGDSSAIAVGDAVMAVGNPLGLDSTVTTGIVSALDRPVSTGSTSSTELVVTNAIQVDAAINPGNSGGPLFDSSGRVIGITSSIATLSQTGSESGSIGLGFAIPVNLAHLVAQEIIDKGSVEHSYLGVYLSDGTGTVDGTTRLGAVVERIGSDSPAASADLKQGDVVVAVDGKPVSGALSLTAFVREHAVGDTVKLTVIRDGKTVDVDVTLTQRQEGADQSGQSDQSGESGKSSEDGQSDQANPWNLPGR